MQSTEGAAPANLSACNGSCPIPKFTRRATAKPRGLKTNPQQNYQDKCRSAPRIIKSIPTHCNLYALLVRLKVYSVQSIVIEYYNYAGY